MRDAFAVLAKPGGDGRIATFRASRNAQTAWCEERLARDDIEAIHVRWSRVAPPA
jgi:hypothetical protein